MVEVCMECKNKRYTIRLRSEDNRLAVERCDECSSEILTDEQAAILARYDGVKCSEEYPCYLYERSFGAAL